MARVHYNDKRHFETEKMTPDECNKWCANRIRAYWRARGYAVKVEETAVRISGALVSKFGHGDPRYGRMIPSIKSDLINGAPRKESRI